MNYPTAPHERAALRERNTNYYVARAMLTAQRAMKSAKCGTYHEHAPYGCQDDGSGCLCECHDGVI